MKINEEVNINYTFRVKKTRLGKLHAGDIFLYGGIIWFVLNRVEGGGKLVRTLTGKSHRSMVKPAKTLVQLIIKAKKF